MRVGTVQGFKGLEADVVVLVGLDAKSTLRPEALYVGASRARAALFVLALEGMGIAVEDVRVDECTGRRLVFFADPDGLPLELSEALP